MCSPWCQSVGWLHQHQSWDAEQLLEMPKIRKELSRIGNPCLICSVTAMASSSVIEKDDGYTPALWTQRSRSPPGLLSALPAYYAFPAFELTCSSSSPEYGEWEFNQRLLCVCVCVCVRVRVRAHALSPSTLMGLYLPLYFELYLFCCTSESV